MREIPTYHNSLVQLAEKQQRERELAQEARNRRVEGEGEKGKGGKEGGREGEGEKEGKGTREGENSSRCMLADHNTVYTSKVRMVARTGKSEIYKCMSMHADVYVRVCM